MPPFRVRQLTIEDGLDLASWSRPGAWHIEDALEAPEPDEGYWAVVDGSDTLLGFCCVGAAARVPGAPQDDYVVDVAIGIRPQLAGRGWSSELGRAAVRYASSVALDRRLRTTVPEWNEVGRHAARQAGFASGRHQGVEPPAVRDLRADAMSPAQHGWQRPDQGVTS